MSHGVVAHVGAGAIQPVGLRTLSRTFTQTTAAEGAEISATRSGLSQVSMMSTLRCNQILQEAHGARLARPLSQADGDQTRHLGTRVTYCRSGPLGPCDGALRTRAWQKEGGSWLTASEIREGNG